MPVGLRRARIGRCLIATIALALSSVVLTSVSAAEAAEPAGCPQSSSSAPAAASDDAQVPPEAFEREIGQRAVTAAIKLSSCTRAAGGEESSSASPPTSPDPAAPAAPALPASDPVTDATVPAVPPPAVAAPEQGSGATATAGRVPVSLFGMHVHNLATGPKDTGANALRLWDTGVTWRELQPEKGRIDWNKLDTVVANAEASGVKDIQYVLGSTPEWAAAKTDNQGESRGPGSASHPKSDDTYLEFTRQVVERYKGRITSYQIWNESDLPDFYAGTPAKLAALTGKAYRLIKKLDPTAEVASAGLVPRDGRYGPGSFEDRYLAGLAAAGWPIDAFVISMYPVDQDPNLRTKYVGLVRSALARHDAPPRQLWESEANFFAESGKPFSTATQENLLARTYISAQELGISRTYWFSWEQQIPILGIRLTTPEGNPLPAARTYRTVEGWMAGKDWRGCQTSKGTQRCGVGAGSSFIVFRDSGQSAMPAPAGSKQLCTIDGDCAPIKAGANVTVSQEPKLIKTK